MRAVIQRVSEAQVTVNSEIVSSIKNGVLALIGIETNDNKTDMTYIANKIIGMRIFDDDQGVMNLSVQDIEGEILLVSQFTLYGDVRKGKRPSYSQAMSPETANDFFETFVDMCKSQYDKIYTGSFGEYMKVTLINDGPVTILLDSKKLL